MADNTGVDDQVAYWSGELDKAKKRYRVFWSDGDEVIDAYRMQKSDGSNLVAKDKYNILYSSTETIRPNLYAQAPKTRVVLRAKDTASDTARLAARLIEGSLDNIKQEEDFDELMNQAVEDYMLPGLGQAWVRYEASFKYAAGADGKPVPKQGGKKDEYEQEVDTESVKLDYLHWQDFLTGQARIWKEVPWVAKRVYMTKKRAKKRFPDKYLQLVYQTRSDKGTDSNNVADTAEIWEIWEKASKRVYWYSEGPSSLLDVKDDPLKLKNFFPCPRPLRAISNTRSIVPRALYSQYKSQAQTLNTMTARIRLLSEALKVVGFYDGSNAKLADALNPSSGNKMIAVDNWAMFAQAGGMAKSVDWVPLDAVVTTLTQLQAAREVAKNEIYEITGFSDIVRGVSKASETLGAQNLKANWAGARVKKMQAEVQRFARDILAIAGEVLSEHCSPATIALYSGIDIPKPEKVQADEEARKAVDQFMAACALIKNEMRRVSVIDIETDSTLLADEEAERKDRTEFLGAAGAFLQQAVPAMEATPELGPLLGAMLMFVVRTFPTSRPIEDEFEKVQLAMANRSPDADKDGKKAQAAADAKTKQDEIALKGQELAAKQASDSEKARNDAAAEANRHAEKMEDARLRALELDLKARELALKEQELSGKTTIDLRQIVVDELDAQTRAAAAAAAADTAAAGVDLGVAELEQTDAHHADEVDLEQARIEVDQEQADADREADEERAQADREAAVAAAKAAAKAAPKPAKGTPKPKG